jgi:hypothetical protein
LRLTRFSLAWALLLLAFVPTSRAEYISLKSGQRLHVTSYQLIGDKYRLQISTGFVDVAVEEVVAIDPEDTFAPLPPPPAPVAPYKEFVKAASSRYSIDEELIYSVIAAESNFDAKAVSNKNARGLMQLVPETAARFGVQNVFDPKENIDAGTHYLSDLLKRYNNDLVLALAAYNAGPERVQQFGRVPPFNETVSYVRRVKKAYEQSKSGLAPLPGPKDLSKQKTVSLFQGPDKNSPQLDPPQQPAVPN